MLSIDNFDVVRNHVLKFDDNSIGRYYYKFVALIRSKDYLDLNDQVLNCKQGARELIVHQWLVSSIDRFDDLADDMRTFVNLFKCRLYVTTDRKDVVKSMLYAKNKLNDVIDQLALGQLNVSTKLLDRLVNGASSVSEASDRNGKRWLFDIDTKDKAIVNDIIAACGEHFVCCVPTANGYHVLANKRFNGRAIKLPDNVELKENALTLVAKY